MFESIAGKEPPASLCQFPDRPSREDWIKLQNVPNDWLLLPAISLSTLLVSSSLPRRLRLGIWMSSRIRELRRVPSRYWESSAEMVEVAHEIFRSAPEWFLAADEF